MIAKSLKEWSAAVRDRDGSCRVCGASHSLVAHHIKPKSAFPDLRLDLANGITLCVDCHNQHHKDNPVRPEGLKPGGKVEMRRRIADLERQLIEMEAEHLATVAEMSGRLAALESIIAGMNNAVASYRHDLERIRILESRGDNMAAANAKLRRELEEARMIIARMERGRTA